MSLSPEEIRNKQFLVALRGYDKVEVEAFLRSVADEFAGMIDRLASVGEEGRDDRPRDLEPLGGLGDRVASVLRAAADGAAAIRAEGEREVAEVRAEAVREAARVTEAVHEELEAANELRAEAERQAAEIRAAARQEGAGIRDEARRELEAARETRAAASREAAELVALAAHRHELVVARAERQLAAMVSAAGSEIDQAVADVLRGCERLHAVRGQGLMHQGEASPDGVGDFHGGEADPGCPEEGIAGGGDAVAT